MTATKEFQAKILNFVKFAKEILELLYLVKVNFEKDAELVNNFIILSPMATSQREAIQS